jgi:hypothetical protein
MKWFETKRTSPATGAALLRRVPARFLVPLLSHARILSFSLCDLMSAHSADLIPNHSLKSQINQWREKMVRQSLLFSLVVAEHLPSGP